MSVRAGIGPPKGLFEDTESWVAAWNSGKNKNNAAYKEIYPKHSINRLAPQTPHKKIHWSFSSWQTSCQRESIPNEAPAAFVATIPEGRVYGTDGSVITPDNYLLADVSLDLESVFRKNVKHHAVFSQEQLPPTQYLDQTVAVLSVLGAHNYYHWMFDLLPRFELLRRGGMDINSIDRFVVPEIRSSFQEETLSTLGIPAAKTVESSVDTHIQARRLIVPSRTGHMSDMPQWTCDFLRREFLPESIKQQKKSERIYVSRSDALRRKLINEEQVIELLSKHGFRSVSLGSMSVAEQASLFHSAEVVIAPHGATLTNLTFCRPGVRVIEMFSPNYVNCSYWVLSSWIAADYYYLLGEGKQPPEQTDPFRFWEDIQVNPGTLRDALKLAGVS